MSVCTKAVLYYFDNRLTLFGWLLFGVKCMALCVCTAVSLELPYSSLTPLPLPPLPFHPPPSTLHPTLTPRSQAQYVFIHDALEELITCGDTAILSHNLRMDIGNLGRIVPGKIITGFQNQFEVSKLSISYICRHLYMQLQTQTSSL